jgi:hypothetical protein
MERGVEGVRKIPSEFYWLNEAMAKLTLTGWYTWLAME